MTEQTRAETRRGRDRRSALIAATLRIIVRDGPGAVKHRTVAAEAGSTHGLVSYYFGGSEKLIRSALEDTAMRNVSWLESAQERLLAAADDATALAEALADIVDEQLTTDRAMGFCVLELHLAAGRDPELRPLIRSWGKAFVLASAPVLKRLGSQDPVQDTRLLAQLINGMVLEQLSVPRPDFKERVLLPNLKRLMSAIAADSAN
ncbi:DNA-binding transcriptional regulator YbjK [Mycobacterium frederiksbergense]|uniref:DNA-binding transcriptional regulator YbjK n=1 Tax=Mycolicibacterium frederiksbergense TaxID=117567 RepID=A0ABT6L8D6_9MYCO|nr:TetR family transcriptional regulator [Mycolicibacterium frederiksbergense]MDH6198497.1 DNA-binding transcriptional regulator YbjK [Mycolicibacterium frederiksbergense]